MNLVYLIAAVIAVLAAMTALLAIKSGRDAAKFERLNAELAATRELRRKQMAELGHLRNRNTYLEHFAPDAEPPESAFAREHAGYKNLAMEFEREGGRDKRRPETATGHQGRA